MTQTRTTAASPITRAQAMPIAPAIGASKAAAIRVIPHPTPTTTAKARSRLLFGAAFASASEVLRVLALILPLVAVSQVLGPLLMTPLRMPPPPPRPASGSGSIASCDRRRRDHRASGR